MVNSVRLRSFGASPHLQHVTMNLKYSLLSCVLVAGSVMGQWAQPRQAMNNFRPAEQGQSREVLPLDRNNDLRAGGDVVFSEDFANGLDGNNGVGAWTLSGANGNVWKRKVEGPVGAYTNANERIQSTTVLNGYMLFASDSANTNWGVNPPAIVASPVSLEGSLVSPVINLSATPFVEIQFEQRLRFCCQSAPHFLEVSTDGGANWSSSFSTSTGVAVNANSGTQVRRINITSAIANDPSNVQFRFRHSGEAGTSHYHWQIDDVKIVELFEYDLRLTGSGTTYWDASMAATYDSLLYTVYPYSQLRPLALNLSVLNNGSELQDATANFTVTRSATTVLDQDQSVNNLMPGEERLVFIQPDFTPPAVAGTYNVAYTVSSDNEDLTPDNSGTASFQVSEFLYARDGGTAATFETGDGVFMILSNAFHISQPVNLHSIAVLIGSQSQVGSLVVGDVRADDLETVLGESQEILVTTGMMNGNNGSNFTHLIFDPPVELQPGMDYMASVQVFGNVRIGENGTSAPQTSFIYYNSPTQGEDWYYTTTTPAIRMNFNPTVGMGEITRVDNLSLGQAIPNPTNGDTRVMYELVEGAAVKIELMDVSGKLVMSVNEGTKAPGQHQFRFDASNLQEGVYFYSVQAADARATGRMVVVK
jgi:hypothetical protein